MTLESVTKNNPMKSWVVDSSKKFIPSLDGIRGIAILMVLCTHFFVFRQAHSLHSAILGALSRSGWIGVRLFFVLSGYLIALGINNSKFFKARVYIARRAGKIIPPFYLSALVACILLIFRNKHSFDYIISFFQTISFIFVIKTPSPIIDDIYWSLGAESVFYLFAPISILLLRRSTKHFSLLLASFLFIFIGNISAIYFSKLPDFPISTRLLGSFTYFGFGIFIAFLRSHFSPSRKMAIVLGSIGILLFMAIYLGVGTYTAMLPWAQAGDFCAALNESILFPNLLALSAALFVIGSLESDWWLPRILSIRPLVFLGIVSYEWYLFHLIFGDLFGIGHANGSLINFVAAPILSAVFSLIFATLVYRYMSLPILRLVHLVK